MEGQLVMRWTSKLHEVSELFRHWDRHSLARATLRYPDRIARRFDSSWCVESVFEYGNTCLVAMNGESRNFAAGILCEEEPTVRRTHAIRPSYGLVGPNVDWCSGFAGGIDRDAIQLVENHIVYVQDAIQECDAVHTSERRV